MSDRFISSVHIQKLGHEIQEIRERALLNIISKLEHGFVYDNDLARSKEILSKLFEWFLFEPCVRQEEALKLLQRILKSDSGGILIKHYGAKAITAEIRQIRSYVVPRLYLIVDDLLDLIEQSEEVHVDVPPLQSDLPLSYRTQETDRPSGVTYTVGSTATPIEGFIQYDSSLEQQTGLREQTLPKSTVRSEGSPFTNYTLKWQPLITSDRHVLELVEQSLKNPTEPGALLHFFEFFIDVMLQDFPAEVFLQRPTIILLFHGYLKSSVSTRLTNSILNCLSKLTKYVIARIYYYRDPCTFNSKETISTQICSKIATPVLFNTEHSYMQSVGSPASQPSTFNSEDEDTALLKSNQLSVPRYCFTTMLCLLDYICVKPESYKQDQNPARKRRSQIGINLSLVVLDKLIHLLSLCLKSDAWDKRSVPAVVEVLHKFEEVLVKFADVLEHFRLEVMSNDCDESNRATHLHLLFSCKDLLVRLVPLSKADFVLPRPLKNVLASTLLDSALARLYPNAHETVFQFVKEFGGRFETDSIGKYKEIKSICNSFTAAIKLLRNSKSLSVLSAMKLAEEGVLSLEFHKNLTFVTIVVSLCANKLPLYSFEDDIFEIAEEVILTLLAHSNPEIQEEMYRLCSERVIATIGPRLNTSMIGAPGSQILFLLSSSIITEICLHGITNDNKQIQKYADDILVHILKCKILVSEQIWNRTVQALIPTLSVLTCYAGKNSTLGRTIISMLDPDSATSLNIPSLEVLKGNLRLLFVDDALAREEAISRLCWLMGSQLNSRHLLPRLNSLQDKALGTVCQLKRVTDLNKVRPSQHFYQPSALYQVLELLNSESVEPVIRRSALTQISVMLEDPLLHYTFLERNGVKVVVDVMRSALTENNYKDYVDCIIPAVSVFKNICLYNASARQELCNNPDVYFYIIRGLFMFCSEDRMRQDCSILLCLLLFNDCILGSPAKIDLSLPHLVLDRLSLPFTCNMHWRTSKHALPSLSATLLSDKWCLSSIQIHWNSEWFGGFREILNWNEINYSESHLSQFDEKLRLTNIDLLALKCSSLDYCIMKCLTDIQNGTSHNAVIDSVNRLEAYVNLYIVTKNDVELGKRDLLTFPWEYSFTRFLNAPPANEEDMLLLISVIKFLAILVPLYTVKEEPCWVILILKDSSHSLPNLLQADSSPELELKTLHQELLNLITVCVWHEQQYLDLRLSDISETASSASWLHIIEIIADNLKFSDTQHFYNLAYLDCVLSCLVHLTTALGWSRSKSGNIPKEPIPGLIRGLCELVGAFHCGKGPSAAVSLMGLSITRHVLLVLNHLLAEMQYFHVKGWEMCFVGESAVEDNVLYTLCSLWLSRDVILRAAILQLLAGLAVSPRAAIELVQEIKDIKTGNGLWETALTILLDNEEASVVRENAALLLANLTSHTVPSSSSNLVMIANLTPISVKKSNNVVGAILILLEDFKFYKELQLILSCLYVKSSFYFDIDTEKIASDETAFLHLTSKCEYAFAYTKNIMPDLNTHSASAKTAVSGSTSRTTVVSPGLVRTVAVFLLNLLMLVEEDVTNSLQEYGLIKMFFRCLTNPPSPIDNTKDLSLYCEILEMNTAVCALLSKAVGNNQMCLGTVLHTRDCLNVMLSLLNPSLYHINLPQLIYLRNKLWAEIFTLIGSLLDNSLHKSFSKSTCSNVRAGGEAITIVSSVIGECGHQPFLQTLCEAISCSSSIDLQRTALTSLTSLLRMENNTTADDFKMQEVTPASMSMQSLLDNVKTPRTPSVEENINENVENVEPEEDDKIVKILWEPKSHKTTNKQTNVLENAYFGKVNRKINELNKRSQVQDEKKFRERIKEVQLQTENEPLMAGAELCRILLHLYDVSNIKSKDNKDSNKKTIVVDTLTSILCVSREAKKLALQNGLVELLIQQLKELHVKLSLESVECLRRIGDKKRVNPILKELGSLIGLITNFMLGDEGVKCAASVLGLADVIHKLWVWFCVDRSLISDALKMLCTYTTDCYTACRSLPLTSSVAGSGPRKAPSNLSLLHEIVGLIFKETELVSRTHDLRILELAFHILHNSCAAVECRHVLAKSNLLQCLSRLHPALTKRQKPWESVELIWLEFLLTLTGYSEGQVCVAKAVDALELIMMLTSSTKLANKKAAMLVLRNIAFYQPNRPRLLNSDDFLNTLQTKLTNGNTEEKIIVATIMWALAVNSQRAKLVLKCANLDVELQECLKRSSLSPNECVDPNAFNLIHHVLHILKVGEKGK